MLRDNIQLNLNISRLVIDWVYADIKFTYNIKMSHIMVSFSDHYDTIFVDRVLSKTEIGRVSWYFNNSVLFFQNLFSWYFNNSLGLFSPNVQKTYFLSLKIGIIIVPLQVTCSNIQNPALKNYSRSFSKNCNLHGDIRNS